MPPARTPVAAVPAAAGEDEGGVRPEPLARQLSTRTVPPRPASVKNLAPLLGEDASRPASIRQPPGVPLERPASLRNLQPVQPPARPVAGGPPPRPVAQERPVSLQPPARNNPVQATAAAAAAAPPRPVSRDVSQLKPAALVAGVAVGDYLFRSASQLPAPKPLTNAKKEFPSSYTQMGKSAIQIERNSVWNPV